jgi:hypothetical protein
MRAIRFFLDTRKLARLRADAARVDEEFEKQERRLSAELQALRMRDAIDSSKRILARTSGDAPRFQTPDPFAVRQ